MRRSLDEQMKATEAAVAKLEQVLRSVKTDWCVKHQSSGLREVLACDVAIGLSLDPPAEGCRFVAATVTFEERP